MTTKDTPKDTGELVRQLTQAMTRFRARLRVESKSTKSKSTIVQIDVLGRIVEKAPVTVRELAKLGHVRSQSMAEVVAELRSAGLIRSEVSSLDRRKVLLFPTAKGKKRLESVYSARAWLGKVMNSELSQQELDILAQAIRILERLADHKDEQK